MYAPQKQFWIYVLLSLYSTVSHIFQTLSTLWKEMGTAEKEGSLPVFDTDSLNTFLPTAGITARLPGKIDVHTPIAEAKN